MLATRPLVTSAAWSPAAAALRRLMPTSSQPCRELSRQADHHHPVQEEVLAEVMGTAAVATLNRQKALNSLNTNMCRLMDTAYRKWATDSNVNVVILRGSGPKAFCAGGDVVSLAKAGKAGDTSKAKEFFAMEYRLDHAIASLPKPHVALIDGITMGGGVGVSVHGPFRVATEKTLFAMPETAIGLFPDVGGGYFLPRLQGHMGMYLALSGARLKGGDVYHAGVATHFTASHRIPDLVHRLSYVKGDHASVQALLDEFHEQPAPFSLAAHVDTIDTCFAQPTVEQMLECLGRSGEWGAGVAKTIATMSPTSCKITAEQLRRGAQLDLKGVLQMEYRLAVRSMDGNDFYEGIRALLIDKDNKPSWQPATLQEVSDASVQAMFEPLPADMELAL